MLLILHGLLAVQMIILDDEDLVLVSTFQFTIRKEKQKRVIVSTITLKS